MIFLRRSGGPAATASGFHQTPDATTFRPLRIAAVEAILDPMNISTPISFQQQDILSFPASSYMLYGLQVHSQLPLPLVPGSSQDPDVTIHFEGFISGDVDASPRNEDGEWIQQHNHWILRYLGRERHVLEFLFDSEGKHIRIRQSSFEWQNSVFVLLSSAFAAAFHLQGQPVLHSTSVVKDKEAFLLTGFSRAGKSSLAAALVAEGLALHSDDIGAFKIESDRPEIQAGYPRLKINHQAANVLGWPQEFLLDILVRDRNSNEKWFDLSTIRNGFHDSPAPLKAVYVLSDRSFEIDTPRIEDFSPGQGALALIRYIYGKPWLEKPNRKEMELCAWLARTVPIFRLTLPDDLNKLRQSARAVIKHVDELCEKRDFHPGNYRRQDTRGSEPAGLVG